MTRCRLPPSLRAVVLLRELRDFSSEETAGFLGISVSAVEARLFRAQLNLRKTLDGGSQSGTRTAASPISASARSNRTTMMARLHN